LLTAIGKCFSLTNGCGIGSLWNADSSISPEWNALP
jgi:hypothetical protein